MRSADRPNLYSVEHKWHDSIPETMKGLLAIVLVTAVGGGVLGTVGHFNQQDDMKSLGYDKANANTLIVKSKQPILAAPVYDLASQRNGKMVDNVIIQGTGGDGANIRELDVVGHDSNGNPIQRVGKVLAVAKEGTRIGNHDGNFELTRLTNQPDPNDPSRTIDYWTGNCATSFNIYNAAAQCAVATSLTLVDGNN